MAQGCSSPSGSDPGVGEAADLGNWLTESTADVYVREKRNVVVEIWGQVAPAVEITDAGPDGHKDQTEGEGEASPTVFSGSAPSTRSWSLVEQGPEDTPVKAKDLFPTTPDFPLRVVAAVKRTGNAGQARIHLLNDEGTAVGCGWRPTASKIQELSVLDYMSEPTFNGRTHSTTPSSSLTSAAWARW